jgi:hypothetical protein
MPDMLHAREASPFTARSVTGNAPQRNGCHGKPDAGRVGARRSGSIHARHAWEPAQTGHDIIVLPPVIFRCVGLEPL